MTLRCVAGARSSSHYVRLFENQKEKMLSNHRGQMERHIKVPHAKSQGRSQARLP